jgi:ABC-type multidrug transport system fused ATPase/permease subunit
LNRFAKELFFIDNLLPLQLSQYMLSVFSILGIFASMCFASPYLALVFAAAVVGYVFFERYYRHTSIELQRLEALSRAPIFSHLSETISMYHTFPKSHVIENY